MKKNKRLMIIVGMLLLFGGISMAYFVGKMLTSGEGASTSVITANIKNSEVKVEGTLQFENYEGMLPGHKEPSIIKVTAIGDNELIPYNVVWEGRNGLGTPLNFTIYRLDNEISVKANCEEVREKVSGGIALSEKCSITNEDKLGNPIGKGTIESGEGLSVTLAERELITSTEKGTVVYYYVVLEYPNENDSQNEDMGENFDGEVTIEASDAKPDIDIVAIKVEQDDGTYKEVDSIPNDKEYRLNEVESTCNNNSKAIWNYENSGVTITNLKQKGTQCYLYFDETGSSKTLKNLDLESKGIITDFSKTSCKNGCGVSENGVYEEVDDFGTSYYFRGSVDNNWVKFGNMSTAGDPIWWRIIRINGDGTIRLIYTGTGTDAPSTTVSSTNALSNQTFNLTSSVAANDNKYVGYQYDDSNKRGHKNPSNVYTQLMNWFSINLNDEFDNGNGRIDVSAGFCGDRSSSTDQNAEWKEDMPESGGIGGATTYYGAYLRLVNSTKQPTLKCDTKGHKDEDYYTYVYTKGIKQRGTDTIINGTRSLTSPIGLITADEIAFAGGVYSNNNSGYWLNTVQNYWTMSPYNATFAYVFFVNSNGNLDYTTVNSKLDLFPVINLKADTEFTGTGISTDPYVIK